MQVIGNMHEGAERIFLMLQGPHGPFFRQLAGALSRAGVAIHRVAFNSADEAEWADAGPLHRYHGPEDAFEEWLEQHLDAHGVTDIVLYGDTRPVHSAALAVARRRGLTTHCLEEGYVRPSWVTYEREGNNGNSPLMSISLPGMARALGTCVRPEHEAPATWGDSRQHLWHSALYHLHCLLPTRRYGRFRGHRTMPLRKEVAFYCRRLICAPWIRVRRGVQESLLLRSSKRFHLVLLQLSFDASMQVHSDYSSTSEFVHEVLDAFAEGAGDDDHLVLKAHPFEDGRENLRRLIRVRARELGIAERVIFVDGGKKLASLLDRARSAITVNSTAAQQALWRGLPVAALGRAIYRKPGLVSEQSLADFIRHPRRPDLRSYWLFREYLMQTSQLTGSYYAEEGRRRLLQTLPGRMLERTDAYDRLRERAARAAPAEAASRPALIVAQ